MYTVFRTFVERFNVPELKISYISSPAFLNASRFLKLA